MSQISLYPLQQPPLPRSPHTVDVALPAAAKQVAGVHRPGPGAGRSERLIDPAGSGSSERKHRRGRSERRNHTERRDTEQLTAEIPAPCLYQTRTAPPLNKPLEGIRSLTTPPTNRNTSIPAPANTHTPIFSQPRPSQYKPSNLRFTCARRSPYSHAPYPASTRRSAHNPVSPAQDSPGSSQRLMDTPPH